MLKASQALGQDSLRNTPDVLSVNMQVRLPVRALRQCQWFTENRSVSYLPVRQDAAYGQGIEGLQASYPAEFLSARYPC